ncbi:MAG: GDP-mannose 4,6-dehydratase [Bacteroidetes bacterium]|nr:GDP-mannose 4,6-dehydratase [Bacteroidota bacterium]
MKTALITGISGQDGGYLAKLLLEEGYRVVGLSRSYRHLELSNLQYLGISEKVIVEECDLLDYSRVSNIIKQYKPDEIYNLAAQSSVGISFKQPIGTIRFNTISLLNILESVREINPNIRIYQASSSEMFGKVEHLPITENTSLNPLSPYAISKTSAHFIAKSYRISYGLFVSCGILFNHESYLRSKNFFVKKVIDETIKISRGLQDKLEVGNIDIRRDFGYAPRYAEAIAKMLKHSTADDFIICSGTSVSLREIIEYLFKKFNVSMDKLVINYEFFRPDDILNNYGDNSKAKKELGWNYDLNFFQVLDLLVEEELKNLA